MFLANTPFTLFRSGSPLLLEFPGFTLLSCFTTLKRNILAFTISRGRTAEAKDVDFGAARTIP